MSCLCSDVISANFLRTHIILFLVHAYFWAICWRAKNCSKKQISLWNFCMRWSMFIVTVISLFYWSCFFLMQDSNFKLQFSFCNQIAAQIKCCTVPFKKTRFFGHLWSKMMYIKIEIKYLKSAARILIFWLQVKG